MAKLLHMQRYPCLNLGTLLNHGATNRTSLFEALGLETCITMLTVTAGGVKVQWLCIRQVTVWKILCFTLKRRHSPKDANAKWNFLRSRAAIGRRHRAKWASALSTYSRCLRYEHPEKELVRATNNLNRVPKWTKPASLSTERETRITRDASPAGSTLCVVSIHLLLQNSQGLLNTNFDRASCFDFRKAVSRTPQGSFSSLAA